MNVGFIGLGNMGNPMAESLLRNGYTLQVYDICANNASDILNNGASWCPSPCETAIGADVVVTSLPSPAAVEEVVLGENGIFEGLRDGSVYIDTTTNEPELMRQIADKGILRGIDVLDAPISGGVVSAKTAALTIFVGGEEIVFKRMESFLRCIGKNVIRMGDIGNGMTTKLINNIMMFINFIGACEGMAIATKANLDPKQFVDAIRPSMGQSRMMERSLDHFLECKPLHSAINLGVKDMYLGNKLANAMNVELEISPIIENILREFQDKGNAQADLFDYIQDYLK
tara:strand:- start:52766 stop:53623 length:858 start_codon:yes stop_codon:yes gene_type:complete